MSINKNIHLLMITTLSSKISSRASFGLKDYPRKAYIDKINPEFIDLSRKNIQQKKQSKKIRSWKTQMAHQLSTIQKTNQRYQKKIQKQRNDLSYLKNVKNRAQEDRKRKEQLNLMKMQELNRKRMESFEARALSRQRSMQSKFEYGFVKKQIANSIKREKQHFSEEKNYLNQSRLSHNRTLVLKVQSDKRKGRESVNSFHRRLNSQSVSRLSRSISQNEKKKKQDEVDALKFQLKCKEQKKRRELLALQLDKIKMEIELLENDQTTKIDSQQNERSSSMSKSVPSTPFSNSRYKKEQKNNIYGLKLQYSTPSRQNSGARAAKGSVESSPDTKKVRLESQAAYEGRIFHSIRH